LQGTDAPDRETIEESWEDIAASGRNRILAMSWRRGEIWFDVEALWFREPVGPPALAGGLVPPLLGGPAVPNGLLASRRRRAESKRRRHLRRVRTTVFMLSPALIVPAAALRQSGGGGAWQAEDAPTLSSVVGAEPPAGAAAELRIAKRVSLETALPRDYLAARRRSARAETYPPVIWHHAISVGLPYDGHLIDGTQLPIDGANWVTWDPLTDSVPNRPDRLYGNQHTIRSVISVIDAYRAANPGAPRVVVGDISYKGGGPMTDEHVSHQNGLDVDVYYPRLDRKLRAPVASDQIDTRLAQDLVNRFVAAGAQLVLVGYGTGLHGPSGVVIPYPNHEYHMHVRFPPPAGG
jgi:hypothetical protein